jgi:hypothetical protein
MLIVAKLCFVLNRFVSGTGEQGEMHELTLVRDLPYQTYQSLPHGLSDGSELFSVTLGEREKGLVVLKGPTPPRDNCCNNCGGCQALMHVPQA